MMSLKVSFYGALRDYRDQPLVLESGSSISAVELKRLLKEKLGGCEPRALALIDESAVADDDHVFLEDELILRGGRLAILPPVCGG